MSLRFSLFFSFFFFVIETRIPLIFVRPSASRSFVTARDNVSDKAEQEEFISSESKCRFHEMGYTNKGEAKKKTARMQRKICETVQGVLLPRLVARLLFTVVTRITNENEQFFLQCCSVKYCNAWKLGLFRSENCPCSLDG